MLDPMPFGGGVTILESFAVCTPIVTIPSLQNVPGLATGMIRRMINESADIIEANSSLLSSMIVNSLDAYADVVIRMLQSHSLLIDF